MPFCPKCGSPLPEGAKFCGACGTSLSAPQQPEPQAYQPEPQAYQPEPYPAPAVPKKAGKKKKLFLFGGIALVLIAAVALTLIFTLGSSSPSASELLSPYAVFLAEDQMFYVDQDGQNLVRVSVDLFGGKEWSDSDKISGFKNAARQATVTGDQKTIYYVDKLDGTSSYSLYKRDLSDPERDPEKVASDVERFMMDPKEERIYYENSSSNFYFYELGSGEKQKFFSDGTDLSSSEDLTLWIFRDNDQTLFFVPAEGEKEKIDSDVTAFRGSSDDTRTVLYQKDDVLYVKTLGEEKIRIDSGVSNDSVRYSDDLKTVYYFKDGALYRAEVGGEKEKIASDIGGVVRLLDNGGLYFIRSADDRFDLMYYDGKEPSAVKKDVSEYSTVYELAEGVVCLYSDGDYYLLSGAECVRVGEEEGGAEDFALTEDGKTLYFAARESKKEDYVLYRATLTDGLPGKAEKVDDMSSSATLFLVNDKPLYRKEYSVKNGTFDLYFDGKKIASDVNNAGGLPDILDGDCFYYSTDENSSRTTATFWYYNGSESVKVAEDLFMEAGALMPNGNILYLKDYSENSRKGTLYLFNGKESVKLYEDVSALVRP